MDKERRCDFMKIKNVGLMAITIAIVGCGSLALVASMSQIKGAVEKEASGDVEIATNVGTTHVNVEEVETEDKVDKVDKVYEFEDSIDKAIKPYVLSEKESPDELWNVAKITSVYEGKVISIRDGLVTKDEAISNLTKIMDYIYGYVDDHFLVPNDIDKTAFEYDIQRQYHMVYGDGAISYGVFVKEDGNIVCTIGIVLEEEARLRTFAMDGLVDLYGGEKNEIPEEYLIENWCAAKEQRQEIYNEYFVKSEAIIKDMLGMPDIRKEIVDVDCGSYFNADNGWSEVCFGYVLKDGTYIKVFYNRVNGRWIGYTIAGYYQG